MPRRYPPEFRRKVPDLVAARRRIAELETELAIHRQAAELLGKAGDGGTAHAPGRDQGAARQPATTGRHQTPTAADLVDRRFAHPRPDQLWVTDIERHEALSNRVGVGDLHRRAVAAAW